MSTEIGQNAHERITPEAILVMQQEIERTGGREVFFAGTVKTDGLVEDVRVGARGHERAVPALIEGLGTGEVVLHNHPSGDIAPSEADLELAAMFGRHGHGVYIIDNPVERVYTVVEPFFEREKTKLDTDELDSVFRPDGRIAQLLPDFEVRPQQVEMMEQVAESFNNDGVAVIEAPTGVGKTVAYLLPAILWAVRNRERVVVTTRTINLQEQVIFKDIPLLAKCLDVSFSAVLVKGRSNYLCPRKLERARSEATLFDDEETEETLEAIADWAEKTRDGSLADLSFVPSPDIWSRICSESDTCSTSQCPNPQRCFVGRARREIAKADILVVNHHMLFSDLAIKRELGNFSSLAVLPAYRRVIFDEAHSIEDSATQYFGVDATRNGALASLGRLVRHERNKERGLIPFVKLRLIKAPRGLSAEDIDELLGLIDNELLPAIAAAREALIAAFSALRGIADEKSGQIGRDIKWRLTEDALNDPDLREIHVSHVLPAADEVLTCAKLCSSLAERLRVVEAQGSASEPQTVAETTELLAYRDRLLRLANVLAEGTSETLEPNTVRWIEIDARHTNIVRIVRCPLQVGKSLAEWVYPNLKTVVMTSATLTVQRRFHFLFARIGLDLIDDREVSSSELGSPFDFASQALLCIPLDIANPDAGSFLDEVADYVEESLSITGGHAFVLFTSFYALDAVHRKVKHHLAEAGVAALKQGEATRTQLLDRFRSDASSVLFATDSFWEGVDVAGEALQCVILPKLPFRVPTEPILQARAEAIEAEGGDAFMSYTVPQAVIKFRQGFGRLIRRRSDRGAILVFDRRVVTRRYGKIFLDSLPGAQIVKGPRQSVFAALRDFFGQA